MYESIQVKSNLFRSCFKSFSNARRITHHAELECFSIDPLELTNDHGKWKHRGGNIGDDPVILTPLSLLKTLLYRKREKS